MRNAFQRVGDFCSDLGFLLAAERACYANVDVWRFFS